MRHAETADTPPHPAKPSHDCEARGNNVADAQRVDVSQLLLRGVDSRQMLLPALASERGAANSGKKRGQGVEA